MGCRVRDHVRAQDVSRRAREGRFHEALNVSLAGEGISQLPAPSFGRLRADLTRLPALRAALQGPRRRRRDLLFSARAVQRASGCARERVAAAA